MKTPLKVGDRVALYSVYGGAEKGSILEVDDADGTVLVETDGGSDWFHPKQCRRLVKKEKPVAREFWIRPSKNTITSLTTGYYPPHDIQPFNGDAHFDGYIHVREVLPKKASK